MNRARLIVFVLPAFALAMPGKVMATPRGDVPPVEPLTPEAIEARRQQAAGEMAKWLPRLVGRFRYEGVADFNSRGYDSAPPDPRKIKNARGLGDCIAIGKGAGVQCVVNVTWPEEWGPQGNPVAGGVSFLGPASTLYGLDARASVIRYLLLDTDGLAADGPATLSGDTLRWVFDGHCEGNPQQNGTNGLLGCRQTTRIYAPADGKYIQMSIDFGDGPPSFNFFLRPASKSDTGKVSTAVPQRKKRQ